MANDECGEVELISLSRFLRECVEMETQRLIDKIENFINDTDEEEYLECM
jgi:hypothetical protein